MKQRRILRLLALVGVLTLIGAACSNDDDPETGGDTAATGATGGAVDCEPTSSVASRSPRESRSTSARCCRSAVTRRRSARQPGRRRRSRSTTWTGRSTAHAGRSCSATTVELSQEDDLCSAEGGQAGATALAADPSIVAVIGTSCSSAALGVADTILSDKGILLISPSNTNPGLTSEEAHQPFYLRTAHNDKIQGAIVADFVYKELGHRPRQPRSTTRARTPTASPRRSARTSRRSAARSRRSRRSTARTPTSSRS